MSNKRNYKPLKSDNVPTTKAHLELVRQELKSDITSLSLKMESGFKNQDSRFLEVDARFIKIDARFDEIDSKFEKLFSIIYEMKALLEEQNSRNRVVLDGYTHLFDKSVVSDKRIENLEKKVFGISQK